MLKNKVCPKILQSTYQEDILVNKILNCETMEIKLYSQFCVNVKDC